MYVYCIYAILTVLDFTIYICIYYTTYTPLHYAVLHYTILSVYTIYSTPYYRQYSIYFTVWTAKYYIYYRHYTISYHTRL